MNILKWIILIALCAWLGYALFDLVRSIIAKRKLKKLLQQKQEECDIEAVDTIEIEDNLDSKN